MRTLRRLIALLMLGERAWKHWMVVRFFRRPLPPPIASPALVSILQPILSGDPTLPACLERNLRLQSRYPLEYIWLVDADDRAGLRICRDLIARHPDRAVRLVLLPPPAERANPKMVKLIAATRLAHGEILCVLDDDTQLPDGGLEQCLPFLDQPGVGLAFGLPYYVNFSNLWSSLVSYFVDSHSLLTYIPYTALTEPFTINGMFYAVRRATLEAVGGFAGLEGILADDFAVAQRFRAHGYRLAQTPLRHGISTQVTGPRHYLSLIQRWFVFPRESLARHLSRREKAIFYGVALAPAIFPLLLVGWLVKRVFVLCKADTEEPHYSGVWRNMRGWSTDAGLWYALGYLGYSFAIFAHFNVAYLRRAAPWRGAWWVPLIQIVFPAQLLAALLSRQRIVWRGHVMQAERGGGFRFVRRRSDDLDPRRNAKEREE